MPTTEGAVFGSEQICLQDVLNIDNLSLAGYCEQDYIHIWMGGLGQGEGYSQSRLNRSSA